jgi:hypothetical protein
MVLLALSGPAQAQKGHHVSAPRPPQVHFSMPKMPSVRYTPPKTPQMHANPPKMPSPAHTPKITKSNTKPASPQPVKAEPNANTAAGVHGKAGHTPTVIPTPVPTTRRVVGRGYGGYRRSAGYYRRRQTRPTVDPALHRLQKLKADLDQITPRAQVNQVRRNVLKEDLMGVAEGTIRPTYPPVQQLSGHLADAMSGRRLPEIDTAQMAMDLKMVMSTAKIGRPDAEAAIARTQDLLRSAGTPPADFRAVADDLKAIATETLNRAQGPGAQARLR